MKINESGRTLLEMIGVITLMGVFTVGGMTLYRDGVARMRVNDLLEHVRKRALVSSSKSSKFTYGMYNKQSGGASAITAYGFGVGDNDITAATHVERTSYGRHAVSIIPVGAINGGHALDKDTCKALLRKQHKAEDGPPMVGSIMGFYQGPGCRNNLSSCGAVNKKTKEEKRIPDIICIAIKS